MICPTPTIPARAPSRRTATGPAIYNCLECISGHYLPCARPVCVACGARAPQDIADVITAVENKRAAA